MDKVRMLNVDARKTAIALTLVCMLIVGMGITTVDAADASPVTLVSDTSSAADNVSAVLPEYEIQITQSLLFTQLGSP